MDDNSGWPQLTDAYGEPYDPRSALAEIESGNAEMGYDQLWQRVHHQGDLGSAAYAVVPELVSLMGNRAQPDWRAYSLIATIAECRESPRNPLIPNSVAGSYAAAMREVVQPALVHLRDADDDLEVRSLLAVIAHAKGQRTIGSIALWAEDERQEALGEL